MDQPEIITSKKKTDTGNSKRRKIFSLIALSFLCVTLAASLYLVGKRVSLRKKATGCTATFDLEFLHSNQEDRVCRANVGAGIFQILAKQSLIENKFKLNWNCDSGATSFRVKNGNEDISYKCFSDKMENGQPKACSTDIGCSPLTIGSGYVICNGFSPALYGDIYLEFSSSTSNSSPTPITTFTPTPTLSLCSEIKKEKVNEVKKLDDNEQREIVADYRCIAGRSQLPFTASCPSSLLCTRQYWRESRDCKEDEKLCWVAITVNCGDGSSGTCSADSSGCSCGLKPTATLTLSPTPTMTLTPTLTPTPTQVLCRNIMSTQGYNSWTCSSDYSDFKIGCFSEKICIKDFKITDSDDCSDKCIVSKSVECKQYQKCSSYPSSDQPCFCENI